MWILNFDEDEDYENYEDEDYENYEEDEDYENYFMNPVVLSLLLTETQTSFKACEQQQQRRLNNNNDSVSV